MVGVVDVGGNGRVGSGGNGGTYWVLEGSWVLINGPQIVGSPYSQDPNRVPPNFGKPPGGESWEQWGI